MEDYYEILNVKKNASQDEIKKSYRKLSMQYHPDRPTGNEEKFKQINKAYETLSNPSERNKYDSPFNNINSTNMKNDIFEMFFNGMPGNMNMNFQPGQFPNFNVFTNSNNFLSKPTPIIKTLHITLTQAYTGINYPLEIERWIHQTHNNTKYTEKEKIYVTIPQGIDDNEIIILKEKGNIIQGKQKGDLKCFIKIKNDTIFKRNGLNLLYEKKITLKDALCGFTFSIDYINDKKYTINNNSGKIINPNFKKQIPNMGMKRNSSTGSLIIEFKIIFPESLTNEQIEKLEKIL